MLATQTFELLDLANGRWLIDRERCRYAEVPVDRSVEFAESGYAWTPFIDIASDRATGDLVIRVTPTRLVRLGH